jgi:hypothetical protein
MTHDAGTEDGAKHEERTLPPDPMAIGSSVADHVASFETSIREACDGLASALEDRLVNARLQWVAHVQEHTPQGATAPDTPQHHAVSGESLARVMATALSDEVAAIALGAAVQWGMVPAHAVPTRLQGRFWRDRALGIWDTLSQHSRFREFFAHNYRLTDDVHDATKTVTTAVYEEAEAWAPTPTSAQRDAAIAIIAKHTKTRAPHLVWNKILAVLQPAHKRDIIEPEVPDEAVPDLAP